MARRVAPIYQLKASLDGIDPPIWRTFLVPSTATLHEVHRILQLLFHWYDYHLYRFDFADRSFEAPDEEAAHEDATRVRLADLRFRVGSTLRYTYDYGDNWIHSVTVEDIDAPGDPDWMPWLLAGERHGPPEDCGGPHRYGELLLALQKPLEDLEDLEDYDRELVGWLDRDFDPDEFSVSQARHALILTSAWGVLRRKR